MVNTALPLRAKDVDVNINAEGPTYRAKSFNMDIDVAEVTLEQMATLAIDIVNGATIRRWTFVFDEIEGQLPTILTLTNGTTTFPIAVTKGGATLTLTDAKAFSAKPSTGDVTNSIEVSGICASVSEA